MIRKKYYTGEQIIEVLHEFCNDYDEVLGMLNRFACLETADVEPIRHGEWIMKPDPYGFFGEIPVCSVCGCTTKMRETYNYCPNCGAKMEDTE